jgi:thiol-disulfide isomerase/thioredoxin
MRTFAVGILLVSAAALVSGAFADVKTHVDAMKSSGKPVVFAVDKGEYTCSSCQPEVKVKANGGPQKVTGHSEYDEIVVAVRSPALIEVVEELNGKHQAYYNYSVSGDGQTLTVKWSDYSGPKMVEGGYTAKRVGPAAAGAHAASGSWKIEQTMPEKTSPK